MLLLNDIYLKSKENKVFKPAAICAHYHVGHQLCTVLLKNGYIKYIDRGKYLYQGKPIDEQLVNEVYNLYSQYKSDQRKEYKPKEKSKLDPAKGNIFIDVDSLADKINVLEQRIIQLNHLVMNMILEVPSKNKSFLHKIFNK